MTVVADDRPRLARSAGCTDAAALIAAIRACRVCVETPRGRPLPHEPRPVLRIEAGGAPVIVCGQAPGTRVHASGTPFTDPSGVRLRAWLGVSETEFYDTRRIGVVPMGFCFPGLSAAGADLPPRRECAPLWHDRLFAALAPARLIAAVGLYAVRYHVARLGRPDLVKGGLGACVADWRRIHAATGVMPMPHPSWRNNAWLKRHPWFDAELLPVLRAEVRRIIGPASPEDTP
jgi:uracil-DNA glycosylase